MKREFRPTFNPLESRSLMSAGLKGVLSGTTIGSILSEPGNQVRVEFKLEGKLGGHSVAGTGWLYPGSLPPDSRGDFIALAPSARVGKEQLLMESITVPYSSGGASGPIIDQLKVTEAGGPFAHDLGLVISVSVHVKPRAHGHNLSITFSPA